MIVKERLGVGDVSPSEGDTLSAVEDNMDPSSIRNIQNDPSELVEIDKMSDNQGTNSETGIADVNNTNQYSSCRLQTLTMIKEDLCINRPMSNNGTTLSDGDVQNLAMEFDKFVQQPVIEHDDRILTTGNTKMQLLDQLHEVLAENTLLRRRVNVLEKMVENYKKIIHQIQDGMESNNIDLPQHVQQKSLPTGSLGDYDYVKKEMSDNRGNCDARVGIVSSGDQDGHDDADEAGIMADSIDNDMWDKNASDAKSDELTCASNQCGDLQDQHEFVEQLYFCEICGQQFRQEALLVNHLPVHADDAPRSTMSEGELISAVVKEENLKNVQAKEGLFSCSLCNERCLTKKRLEFHVKKHSGQKCVMPTSKLSATRRRRVRKSKPVHCHTCQKIYADDTSLRRHTKRMHEGIRLVKFCEICGKGSENLKAHMMTHSDEKIHTCSVCNRSFTNPYVLKKHIAIHSMEKTHLCTICGKAFVTAEQLYGHRRFHSDNKRFSCETCGHPFMLKTDLQKHMQTHTGERPHKCTFCGRKFARTNQLKRHLKIHSPDYKILLCPICGRKFLQQDRLDTHILSHVNDRERCHTCSVCNRGFTQAHHLKKHMFKLHTNSK